MMAPLLSSSSVKSKDIFFINRMAEFNVLQNNDDSSSANNSNIKIKYLNDQKERLQVEIEELRLNNKLLRSINTSLDSNKPIIDLRDLIRRNEHLEELLNGLNSERQRIYDELFLMNQIRIENEKELHQIASNYEEKIIELRRSIQMKEGNLQKLEAQINADADFEETIIPPYSVGMHFHAEFDDYKEMNGELKEKNKKLQEQNEKLKKENQQISHKLSKLQKISNSRCSFMEYRILLNEKQKKSLPHNAQMQFEEIKNSKRNENTKTNINEISVGNSYLELAGNHQPSVKRMLKMKHIEARELKQSIRNLKSKNQSLAKTIKTLLQSNKFYQKSRVSLNERLEGYRLEALRLKELFLRRRDYIKAVSEQKNKKNFTKPSKKELKHKNEFKPNFDTFKKESEQIKEREVQLNMRNKKRSLSCMIDFVCMKQKEEKRQSMNQENQNEFSRILGSEMHNEMEDSISIIGGNTIFEKKNNKNNKKVKELNELGSFLEEVF